MMKDNTVSTLLDDNMYRKFREYWMDRENITQERVSASAAARELIEYALDHMNGKQDTKHLTESEENEAEFRELPDKAPDAKEDTEHNMFKDIIV